MDAPLQQTDDLAAARRLAREFQLSLEPKRKKQLGQFFTGLPLSRLVAALSVSPQCRTVIDPMSGHGDLLDATVERACAISAELQRVDGIDVDQATATACQSRMLPWSAYLESCRFNVVPSSAFDHDVHDQLEPEGYDLVITNPPYVRYQSFAGNRSNDRHVASADIRDSLLHIAESRTQSIERPIWQSVIRNYSGLADLSIPSWLLAAMLTKPGGTLAVVVPATWRNRDYGKVIRYVLAKCFQVETIVADSQPGWFSEALVRTHVVVAQRLPAEAAFIPLRQRTHSSKSIMWLELQANSMAESSLVGHLFPGKDPEGAFAKWIRSRDYETDSKKPSDITVSEICHRSETATVLFDCRQNVWTKTIESDFANLPLFSAEQATSPHELIPKAVKGELFDYELSRLEELESAGISVSQGLRTGCNGFFYVKLLKESSNGVARVSTSSLLGSQELDIPAEVLKPVIKRQSDLATLGRGFMPQTRLLDLRHYVLPEDMPLVQEHTRLASLEDTIMPRIMDPQLATMVRQASLTRNGPSDNATLIPKLSAVATNIRLGGGKKSSQLPRFWYMIPDLMPRHTPSAFVPRINQNAPWTVSNRSSRLVVDANFSTFVDNTGRWSGESIAALLNSSWCQACMEAMATPMGGGALKLEATHLKRLPVPSLSMEAIERLHQLGCKLHIDRHGPDETQKKIDDIVIRSLFKNISAADSATIIGALRSFVSKVSNARQGK